MGAVLSKGLLIFSCTWGLLKNFVGDGVISCAALHGCIPTSSVLVHSQNKMEKKIITPLLMLM